jgi:DNA-binding MurR/RpiR family transcriptional regulator
MGTRSTSREKVISNGHNGKPPSKPHDGMPGSGNLSKTPLEESFAKAERNLSSSRKRLISDILQNSEDTYFLSSRELAQRYGVDAATIVRTIQVLGYDRYADFAADLRSHFVLRMSVYTVMKAAARENRSVAGHIEHGLEMEANNLNALRSELSAKRVIEVARLISKSRRVLIVGIDLAATLSHLLSYGLVSLGINAEAPLGSTGNLLQKVRLLEPRDLLVAISFGRCLRDTVDSAISARDRRVPTFAITDSDRSPLARYCDSYWIASIANPSFNASYVAPVAAINALLVACAHLRPTRSLALLKEKEKELKSGSRWYRSAELKY